MRSALSPLACASRRQARGHTVTAIDVPIPGRHVHAAQMDSLLMIMGAFGVLALLMSGFLVVNLLTATLAGQLREIGVMKALGARPSQLAAMYFVFALALGVFACAIAIPLAAYGGRAYASVRGDNAQLRHRGPLDSALRDRAAAARGAAPSRALGRGARRARQPHRRRQRAARCGDRRGVTATRRGGWSGFAVRSGRCSFRCAMPSGANGARRSRSRRSPSVAPCFSARSTSACRFERSVASLFDDLLRFDMAIRLDAPHSADSVDAVVSHIAGIERAEEWSGARATRASAGELAAPFTLTAIPGDARLLAFPWCAGAGIRDRR